MKKASIAEMSAFVAIAEHASFAKAAKQLGVSRSSLSESLRSLEERLGVRLINRTTRSVAMTQAGERLLVQLRPLLDNFDAARWSFADHGAAARVAHDHRTCALAIP
jgi:DNA-binding transcriptional LysR family regulator